MTTQEAKDLKIKLEANIRKLINDYQLETNLFVASVNLQSFSANDQPSYCNVKVEVRL